jgi:hypothetical protein
MVTKRERVCDYACLRGDAGTFERIWEGELGKACSSTSRYDRHPSLLRLLATYACNSLPLEPTSRISKSADPEKLFPYPDDLVSP